MSPVYSEIDVAADLRRRALALERCASADRFYGVASADRIQFTAQAFRAMARLAESAPFETEGGVELLAMHAAGAWWAR